MTRPMRFERAPRSGVRHERVRSLPVLAGRLETTGSTRSWLWYRPELGLMRAGTVDQAAAVTIPVARRRRRAVRALPRVPSRCASRITSTLTQRRRADRCSFEANARARRLSGRTLPIAHCSTRRPPASSAPGTSREARQSFTEKRAEPFPLPALPALPHCSAGSWAKAIDDLPIRTPVIARRDCSGTIRDLDGATGGSRTARRRQLTRWRSST
jgi:hypothetical protein